MSRRPKVEAAIAKGRKLIMEAFAAHALRFHRDLNTVFPECAATLGVAAELQSAVQQQLVVEVETYFREMRPHFHAVSLREMDGVFGAVQFYARIDMATKWAEVPESQEPIAKHVDVLNTQCRMFCEVSEALLDAMVSVASRTAARMKAGNLRIEQLDVLQLGREVVGEVGTMSESEVMEEAEHLMDIVESNPMLPELVKSMMG
jgi:hypothetical protein